jgi:hypothetical protein
VHHVPISPLTKNTTFSSPGGQKLTTTGVCAENFIRQHKPAASFAARSKRWTWSAARPDPKGPQNAHIRAKNNEALRRTAADPVAHRAYLLRASLIDSVRKRAAAAA